MPKSIISQSRKGPWVFLQLRLVIVVCVSFKVYNLITIVDRKLCKGTVYNCISLKQRILNKMEPYILK